MHMDARPGRKPAQHLNYAGVIMADIMVSHGVGCRREDWEASTTKRKQAEVLGVKWGCLCVCVFAGEGGGA
jgi:hypothetical protein